MGSKSHRKYKILFSIPVHERPDVIADQIININTMSPECAIVLHFSKSFNDKNSVISLEKLLEILKTVDNVIINPNKLETHWGSIIQAHISNFNITKDIDYEYFAILSSNELFVRKNVYEYVKQYDCGYKRELSNGINVFDDKHNYSEQFKKAQKDPVLIKMLTNINPPNPMIYYSSSEGAFFKKELSANIFNIINMHFDYSHLEIPYIREEYFLGSIIENYMKYNGIAFRVGKNFTIRCKKYSNSYEFYSSIRDVNHYKKQDVDGVYSIKKVKRDINDYLRQYIRQLFNYVGYEELLTNNKLKKSPLLFLKLYDFIFLNNSIRRFLSFIGINIMVFPRNKIIE